MDAPAPEATTEAPAIGHNNPPEPVDPLAALEARLVDDTTELFERMNALLETYATAPETVTSEGQSSKMTDLAGMIAALWTALEEKRKELKKPFDDAGKVVQTFFKTPLSDLDQAKRSLASRIGAWNAEKERKAREEADRARREAEERARAAKSAAEVQEALDAAREAETLGTKAQTRGDYNTLASTTKRWTFEVEDLAKVPTGYLKLDEKLVRDAIRAGVRDIPGLRIFEEATTTIRG